MTEETQTVDEEQLEIDFEYPRESVRLAELRMTEQSALQDGYERKAVLLITVCLVIVGYLLSGEWTGWVVFAKLAAVILPVISAILGMQVLRLTDFWFQGLHPDTTEAFPYFDGKTNTLREYVLQEYANRIDENQKVLEREAHFLDYAKRLLYAGLAISLIVALLEKFL